MELKKEKEDLALEVEREEELLTNTLQKKLNQVGHVVLLFWYIVRAFGGRVTESGTFPSAFGATCERIGRKVSTSKRYRTDSINSKCFDILAWDSHFGQFRVACRETKVLYVSNG